MYPTRASCPSWFKKEKNMDQGLSIVLVLVTAVICILFFKCFIEVWKSLERIATTNGRIASALETIANPREGRDFPLDNIVGAIQKLAQKR